VWTEDPDGNLWEVFVVKGDAAEMHADPVKDASGCCAPTSLSRAQQEPLAIGKKRECC
jgi:hypothetical protein